MASSANNLTYRIVFSGELQQGQDLQRVKAKLVKLLNTDLNAIQRLLSGKRYTIAKQLNRRTAERYRRRLAQAGVVADVVPEEAAGRASAPGITAPAGTPATESGTMVCPKCNAKQAVANECGDCGILIEKYLAIKGAEREGRERMDDFFATVSGYQVTQRVEWLEVFTGFEQNNKYEVAVVYDRGYRHCVAYEHSKSILNYVASNFLGAWRPFEMVFKDEHDEVVARFRRAFRFFYHHVDVLDPRGSAIGSVTREFAWTRNRYTVRNKAGRELFTLSGNLFIPWTFRIRKDRTECGEIKKKWSGILKESSTDADAFGVKFPRDLAVEEKVLLLAAVFLIDFVHFEENTD